MLAQPHDVLGSFEALMYIGIGAIILAGAGFGLAIEPVRPFSIMFFVICLLTYAMKASFRSSSPRLSDASWGDVMDVVEKVVEAHKNNLAGRRNKLLTQDAYGNARRERWHAEQIYFIENVIIPELTTAFPHGFSFEGEEVVDLIDEVLDHDGPVITHWGLSDDTTPAEFEEICARVLESAGWKAQRTKGSGDQGADVLANKNGVSLVVQCKLYSGKVGNKAVQEVAAARLYYKANYAAVVCNSGYTPSAEHLARASKVKLLLVAELKDWALNVVDE